MHEDLGDAPQHGFVAEPTHVHPEPAACKPRGIGGAAERLDVGDRPLLEAVDAVRELMDLGAAASPA